ncbi:MAG: DUF5666 domain-containing protein [Nitrosomonas sp.]|nr:MAG: DUF5666 domain-containing protein [Nitrosomonas sp.]
MKQKGWAARSRVVAWIVGWMTLIVFGSTDAVAKNNCGVQAVGINPAHGADSGIGGTGVPAAKPGMDSFGRNDGGIGGTGSVADRGGIGGTGIVGVITGFASICVNGLEVHYSTNTPIVVDGHAATMRELAIGQLVAARATGTGFELTADNIAVIHAVVGPVGSFSADNGEMRVLDQTVRVGAISGHEAFADLNAEDWVRVSGHRLAGGAIAASRIEVTAPLAQARISGYVSQSDEYGFVIGETQVRYDSSANTEGISSGTEVQVAGYWDGTILHARHLWIEPTSRSLGSVEHVVIEGYVHNRDNRELNLNNRVIALDPGMQISGTAINDLKVDQRVQISGRVGTDHRIVPDRAEVVNAAAVPVFERIDGGQADGKIEMRKEIDGDPDNKSSAGNDDQSFGNQGGGQPDSAMPSIKNNGGSVDAGAGWESGGAQDRPDTTHSELLNRVDEQRDFVRDIDDRRDSEREAGIPDSVRDFSDHRDWMLIDR